MISIITSTYNRPKRLHRAIESVINQSYKDWELIIVDDCSTTDTKAVIDGFDDERIRLIQRTENFGNDTRPKNEGILASNGEYICFLDDDNTFKVDHLAILLKVLEAKPELSGVYGDRLIYEKGEQKGVGVRSDFDRSLLMQRNYIDTSDILLRRKDLFEIGGFDEQYKKYVDWNLWIRFAKDGKVFERVPQVITNYNIEDDNKSLRKEDTLEGGKPAWNPIDLKVRLDYLGKQKPTTVAVFSLTYDRLEYTKECFETLHKTAGYKFDHFVVDNGSTDGTQDWLKDNDMFKKVILNEENKGISIASNQALKEIGDKYDVIMKVDNDAYFKTNGWLKKMVEIHDSFPMIALSCYIEGLRDNPGGSPRVSYITMQDELVGVTNHLGGICHFVDSRGYDGFEWNEKSFLHGVQDLELSAYLNLKGYLMGYLENFMCEHKDGTDGQHKKYSDYFERRKLEKRTRPVGVTVKDINTPEHWNAVYKEEGLDDPNYRNDMFSWNIIKSKIGKTGKLLDVGCGNGYLLSQLGDEVEKYGIDLSEEGIKVASDRTNAKLSVGNIYNIPHEDDAFDCVVTTETLEHIIDINKALSEINRVLKVGGKTVNIFPYKDLVPSNEHVAEYDEVSARELFEKYFDDVEVEVVSHPYFCRINLDGTKSQSMLLVVTGIKNAKSGS